MRAIPEANAYPVSLDWTDPETGIRWISLPLASPAGYAEFAAAPGAVSYDGERFARSAWNSDTGRIYYRTRKPIASGV